MAHTVFINYRAEDSQLAGALIYHKLVDRFGESRVFLDNISITVGDDFKEVLLNRLRQSSILLAIIGPRWLSVTDSTGRRRIDAPDDWVRRELAEGLALGLRVIPVVTDDAQLPPADLLPADIAALSQRQFLRLRRRHTKEDLTQLIDKLTDLDPCLVPAATAVPVRPPPVAIPRQLPSATRHFVGRLEEQEILSGILDGGVRADAVVISAIGGTAGVGKTALAVQWAHRVRDQFPDGDLYVDLRGYGPGAPLEPGAALAGFLHALGIDGVDIPQEAAERAAQFRTLMNGRRMLVVLDNARSETQVRPLLPAAPSCLVLVTSRSSLAGLVARDGAHRVDLGLLPAAESFELLRTLVGARVDAESAAARELADRCAGLPLALRIVAELAVARPTKALTDLVTELADVRRRLDLLDAGGDPHTAVRAVFSWSYNGLPPSAARIFRLLGCHPGRTFDEHAVAALGGIPTATARELVEILFRAHLIDARAASHYGMHDLLRDYAAELAIHTDTPADRTTALSRLFGRYLATACSAMDLVAPHDKYRRPHLVEGPTKIPRFSDYAHALAWLEDERPNLVASVGYATAQPDVDAWYEYVLQMSGVLYRYFETRAYDDDAFAVHGHAFDLCQGNSDLSARAIAVADVGHVYERVGRYTEALQLLKQAINLAHRAGDRVTEARGLNGRGATCGNLGLYEEALEHHRRALLLALDDDNLSGRGHAWGHLGVIEQRLGNWNEALHHHQRALAVFEEERNPTTQGRTLNNLGYVHLNLGQFTAARDSYQQAAQVARENRNRRIEITALNGLGSTALATGSPAEALQYHARARDIATEANDRRRQGDAHDGLGHAHQALGHPRIARRHWQHALALYNAVDAPQASTVKARLISHKRQVAESSRPSA